MKELDIKHVLVATACPSANIQIERMNRFMTSILSKVVDNSKGVEWDLVLTDVEFVFNNTHSRSIGTSPSKMLWGIDKNNGNEDFVNFTISSPVGRTCLDQIREMPVEKNRQLQEYNKIYNDRKCRRQISFKEGDYTMVRNVAMPGIISKLIPNVHISSGRFSQKIPFLLVILKDFNLRRHRLKSDPERAFLSC